jgi:hypothetical protein
MQADELKAVRCAAPEYARWSFSAEQQVLRRLDKAFKSFFGRGAKGFPRFRASARYHAAAVRVGDGLTALPCANPAGSASSAFPAKSRSAGIVSFREGLRPRS